MYSSSICVIKITQKRFISIKAVPKVSNDNVKRNYSVTTTLVINERFNLSRGITKLH